MHVQLPTMSQSQWQRNLVYSPVQSIYSPVLDENENDGGKQSPSDSDKLSPKMVGGKVKTYPCLNLKKDYLKLLSLQHGF